MVGLDLLIPVLVVTGALTSAMAAMGRRKIKLGKSTVDFDRSAAEEIRNPLNTVPLEGHQQQYAYFASNMLRVYRNRASVFGLVFLLRRLGEDAAERQGGDKRPARRSSLDQ